MASSIKNELRVKTIRAKNKNAKYKLTYKRVYGTTNTDGNLSYSYSKTTNLSYKD